MMDANKIPWEKGKIFEQVKVKISCITAVPMNSATRMALVQRFTTSANLETENELFVH